MQRCNIHRYCKPHPERVQDFVTCRKKGHIFRSRGPFRVNLVMHYWLLRVSGILKSTKLGKKNLFSWSINPPSDICWIIWVGFDPNFSDDVDIAYLAKITAKVKKNLKTVSFCPWWTVLLLSNNHIKQENYIPRPYMWGWIWADTRQCARQRILPHGQRQL